MKTKLLLGHKYLYESDSEKELWYCGYIYFNNKQVLSNKNLGIFLLNVPIDKLEKQLQNINGNFSIIIKLKAKLIIISDYIRSHPIFYLQNNNTVFISDKSEKLLQYNNKNSLDKKSSLEFNNTGYVTGENTLIHNIKQTLSGQILYIKNDSKSLICIDDSRYFIYYASKRSEGSKESLLKKLDSILMKTFTKIIEDVNEKTLVIPLSGGYDSRLIVAMFKRLGHKNIICYSYGVPNNLESKISKKVANQLGFKWIFIPYTASMWSKLWYSKFFKDFIKYGGNYSTIAHTQDYLAVEELTSKELIPLDSIFIPGHTGDFIAGKHFKKIWDDKPIHSYNSLKNSILKAHYNLNNEWVRDLKLKRVLEQKVESVLNNFIINEDYNYNQIFELWEWQERQSKFIACSVNVYEYFNYEWRMPLWENRDILEFFMRLPIQFKTDTILYDYFLEEILFEKYDLNYKKADKVLNKKSHFREVLRRMIPHTLVYYYRHSSMFSYNDDLDRVLINEKHLKENKIKFRYTGKYNHLEALLNMNIIKKSLALD